MTNNSKAFVQGNKLIYPTFRQKLMATTPDFRPYDNSQNSYYDPLKSFDLGAGENNRDPRVKSRDLIGIRGVINE